MHAGRMQACAVVCVLHTMSTGTSNIGRAWTPRAFVVSGLLFNMHVCIADMPVKRPPVRPASRRAFTIHRRVSCGIIDSLVRNQATPKSFTDITDGRGVTKTGELQMSSSNVACRTADGPRVCRVLYSVQ